MRGCVIAGCHALAVMAVLLAAWPVGAAPAVEIGLDLVAKGLSQPLRLKSPPSDPRRFVVEQTGRIRILTPNGELLRQAFLDLGERMVDLDPAHDERGLLGLAFHPRFADNGRFYVYYSAPLRTDTPHPGWDHTSIVSEFRVLPADRNRADPASERVLLRIDQPMRLHNGGTLAFGPDRHLYIALGDGGDLFIYGEGDTVLGNAQTPDRLLGKILRIDVNGHPYRVPGDNPFVDDHRYRPEIWALGLRNPWRCAFDTGGERALICGDVGESRYEEVNRIRAGGNYGWPIREGRHCFWPDDASARPDTCRSEGLTDPVVEIVNCALVEDCQGRAIIGGYVYRGQAVPALRGKYLFGDWAAVMDDIGPSLFAATPSMEGTMWPIQPLEFMNLEFRSLVLGFGQDADGEIYVLGSTAVGPANAQEAEGRIYKIVAAPAPAEPQVDDASAIARP